MSMPGAGPGAGAGERWAGGPREEYETQHFGFGARRLQLALHGVIEQNIINSVRNMESYLQTSLQLNDNDGQSMTRACDALIALYIRRSAQSIKNIDIEIEKILEIPSSIVLPEDEEHATQMTEEEYQTLRNEVSSLQKRVKRAALMEALLTAEEEELKSVEKNCEFTRRDIEALDSCSKKLTTKCEVIKTLASDTELLCAKVPFAKVKSEFEKIFDE